MDIIFFDGENDIVGEAEASSFADATAALVANYQENGARVAVWSHPEPRCGNVECRTALWFQRPDDPSHFEHECGSNPDLYSKPFSKATRCNSCSIMHYDAKETRA